MKVTFAAACVAAGTSLFYFGAAAWQAAGIGHPLDRIWQWVSSLSPLWSWLVTLVNAVVLVLQRGGQQYLLIALGVAMTMYLMCVAAGTACYRLALNRR